MVRGWIGILWGLGGIFWLLIAAIYRLGQLAIDSTSYEWLWIHWTIMVLNTLFMLYSEGYKGFQLKFSPRVAARARYLLTNPDLIHVLLAPLFLMGFIYSTPRRKVTSGLLVMAIIIFIIIIRSLPQPWRGVFDVGVVAGLSYGTITLVLYLIKVVRQPDFQASPEFPDT